MHEVITYEEALRKYQQIEFDDDWNTLSVNQRLKERIDMMQKNIHDISLINVDLWCTIFMMEGDTKYTCQHIEDK